LNKNILPDGGERFLKAWGPVNDDKLGRLQATSHEIIEKSPPGGFAFSTHVLHRQKHFLAILPNAKRDKQRDRCRLLIEPDAYYGAVEDKPDDWLLGKRTATPSIPIGRKPTGRTSSKSRVGFSATGSIIASCGPSIEKWSSSAGEPTTETSPLSTSMQSVAQ